MATAKQTKTAPEGAAATPDKAAAKAAREAAASKDHFTFKAELTKGAPQARGIVNILKAAGKKGLTREELVAKMNGVITTRQPLGRILSYYQKDLEVAGAITIVRAAGSPGQPRSNPLSTAPVAATPAPAAA